MSGPTTKLLHRANCLVFLAMCAASPVPAAEPRLEVADGRWLTIVGLPPILDDEEVEPELETGLTATFVFVVDLPDVSKGKAAGAARIGVRYELWEEVFHVTLYSLNGIESSVVDSPEKLRAWWRDLRFEVVDLAADGRASARQARVRLDVVPFSQSEQVDTQRWFAESVRRAEAAGSAGDSSVVIDQDGDVESIFSLLIATSIRSRPLRSYSWTVALPARPAAE